MVEKDLWHRASDFTYFAMPRDVEFRLPELLLEPVRRVENYVSLLAALRHNTPLEHADIANLDVAIKSFTNLHRLVQQVCPYLWLHLVWRAKYVLLMFVYVISSSDQVYDIDTKRRNAKDDRPGFKWYDGLRSVCQFFQDYLQYIQTTLPWKSLMIRVCFYSVEINRRNWNQNDNSRNSIYLPKD